MEKIKINEIIVVEGKYDKIKLSSVFDAVIITTDGFGIYKNKEKADYLRKLAEKNGIIVLTDADYAGMQIRSYLKKLLGNVEIKNAYIPEIKGKEKRKEKASSCGLLGVEGIDVNIIKEAILNVSTRKTKEEITKKDLFLWGLTGGKDCSTVREKLLLKLGLPSKMTTNGMLDAFNSLYNKNEIEQIIKDMIK